MKVLFLSLVGRDDVPVPTLNHISDVDEDFVNVSVENFVHRVVKEIFCYQLASYVYYTSQCSLSVLNLCEQQKKVFSKSRDEWVLSSLIPHSLL